MTLTSLIWIVVMVTLGSLPTSRSVTPWNPSLPWKPTMSNYHNHPCSRECVEGAPSLVCEYDFIIEYYYTLTRACYGCPYNQTDCTRPHCVPADGRSRGILTVNRMIPGPGIHVCVGDAIKVNVKNKLEGSEGTTIHWHGVLQHGTPYMDGVAMLTQCPIHAHSTFQYNFLAELPGTHYWHAHAGLQRADGLFGALVIRQPRSRDVHGLEYDFDLPDHTVLINDWLSEMSATRYAGHHHAMTEHSPDSILINGHGSKHVFSESPSHSEHSHGHGGHMGASKGHDGHEMHPTGSMTHGQPTAHSESSIISGHNGMTHSDGSHDQNSNHLSRGPTPTMMPTESPMSHGDHPSMTAHDAHVDMGQPMGSHAATTPEGHSESAREHLHTDGIRSSDSTTEGHNHHRSRRSSEKPGCGNDTGHQKDQEVHTPNAVFLITPGFRSRFRLISNGVNNCPIHFSIDNHTLLVISSDGSPFKPVKVESLNLFAGERYDVIIEAINPVGNYWIRTRGLADCGPEMKSASQTAILRYLGAPDTLPSGCTDYESGNRRGMKLNPFNEEMNGDAMITVADLLSTEPNDISLKPIPDRQFYLAMDFNMVENYRFHDPEYYSLSSQMGAVGGHHAHHLFTPQINGITYINPPSPPLSQYHRASQYFCDKNDFLVDCKTQLCECTHRLKVKVGEVVELVLIDEGKHLDNSHPMHLHGHSFRVVAMEKLNTSTSVEYVKMRDRIGLISRNLDRPITKDTVNVPDGGYTIVRFHAKNPGFWLLHCHIAFHMAMGMSVVIQVGEVEQMPAPPRNFPRCGDWTPETQQMEEYPECGQQSTAYPLVMGTDVANSYYGSSVQPHYISNFNPPQPNLSSQSSVNATAKNMRMQMFNMFLTGSNGRPTRPRGLKWTKSSAASSPSLDVRPRRTGRNARTDHHEDRSDRVLSTNPLLYPSGRR
ncbi:laccase-7-like isoform X2 [Mizuhopecten yessoensis]|uniref:Laccase n=1 Tax=Mizuhopecten yessoensis TaxID=6573 RepID=A0A210QH55_MIZYE|nr:laccase-7-like isoform X2 [Mizuhopecten yessoensis]OWF48064.1 Laccase [Mizuhopecten yessoensis]